jgi:hypothetical protein
MHTLTLASRGFLLFVLTVGAAAQGFKPYPGATKYTPPDTSENREAMKAQPPGTTTTAYLTNDSYDKVVAFYKTFAKQYDMPRRHGATGPRLPNGQEIQQTFMIFDAADIITSKNWAKIQHPFVGSFDMKNGTPDYKDIRDITEIVLTEKK